MQINSLHLAFNKCDIFCGTYHISHVAAFVHVLVGYNIRVERLAGYIVLLDRCSWSLICQAKTSTSAIGPYSFNDSRSSCNNVYLTYEEAVRGEKKKG